MRQSCGFLTAFTARSLSLHRSRLQLRYRLRQRAAPALQCAASSKLLLPPPGWAKDVTRVRLSRLTSVSRLPTPVFPSFRRRHSRLKNFSTGSSSD
ncbi:hypothetical protein NDU88_005485 [Pleurodeles waltl]|uniref:Uncharacterized protein n=1 Tax=Pleurodeles waltl TaxID=8319 RepID=A0AAV7MD01_PLEWA|nr:hypothetical protein NDU88_005485 [Pleurodeles waltl]